MKDNELFKQIDKRVMPVGWELVEVTFTSADTDVEIPTKIRARDPEAIQYSVVNASGPPLVYRDTSATRVKWVPGIIRLRSAIAGLKVILVLSVPAVESSQLEGGSKTIARGLLPSELAYEDEANTFSAANLFTATGNQFSEILAVNKGLLFPATQVASSDANTLDDYEEGTWTPTFSFVTNGNLSFSYTARAGTYIKIGKSVTVSFFVQGTPTHTTASGTMRITGLPFASDSISDGFWFGAMQHQFLAAGTPTDIVSRISNGGLSFIELISSTSGAGAVGLSHLHFTSGVLIQMLGTITYRSST